MKRVSVKISGWLVDMLSNLSSDLRSHIQQNPTDISAKRWLVQAEASYQVARQAHLRAKDEKANFKKEEKK